MNQHCRLSADARRETIIGAAIRLFSEKGFKGTTTRELSQAVGVSEPVLYEHFRTKHELYEAMLERVEDVSMRDLNERIARYRNSRDRKSFLVGVARAMVEWFRKDPEFVRLLIFSALEREHMSRSFHERFRGKLVEVLAETECDVDPEIAVHAFICMIAHHGMMQVLFDYQPPLGQDEALEELVRIFLRGIKK